MSDDELSTLLAEVEGILNSRPLVPIVFDLEGNEPLTPNHLLLLRGNPNLPPGLFEKCDSYAKWRWAQVQYLANQFWVRWVRDFLPGLNQRVKWLRKTRNFRVNDIVLMVDESQPHSRWTKGRILETYPGKDGVVRTVMVRTPRNAIKRPITKLCLLEAAD